MSDAKEKRDVKEERPLLYRPVRAFHLLGLGRTAGYALIRSGALKAVRLGPRAIGIDVDSVEKLAREGTGRATQKTAAPAAPRKGRRV
jgi:hypothetical protein